MYSTYIVILILLLVATSSPIQVFLQALTGLSSLVFGIVYAIVLFGIYIGLKKLLKLDKENFWFELSPSANNRCSKVYKGKPNSWQWTQVGSGDCNPESQPLGFIQGMKSCQAIGDAYEYPEGVYDEKN